MRRAGEGDSCSLLIIISSLPASQHPSHSVDPFSSLACSRCCRCQGGASKGEAERKMSEPSPSSQPKAPAHVSHEVTHKASSAGKAGVVTVLDCTSVELMELEPPDQEEHDIHWLKQQVRGSCSAAQCS